MKGNKDKEKGNVENNGTGEREGEHEMIQSC